MTTEESFNLQSFHESLLDEKAAIGALQQFVQRCETGEYVEPVTQLLQSNLFQDVSLFIRHLTVENRPIEEVSVIFQFLKFVFLVINDLGDHKDWTLNFVNYLDQHQLFKVFLSSISKNNHNDTIRSALLTLTCMVTSNEATAPIILRNVGISEVSAYHIFHYKDIRCSAITYIVSYFMTEDANLIRELLAKKDFWKLVFCNLKFDNSQTIVFILKNLMMVMKNPSLKKSDFTRVLNSDNLKCVFDLLPRKALGTKKGRKYVPLINQSTEVNSIVVDVVFQFFKACCIRTNEMSDLLIGNCSTTSAKKELSAAEKLLSFAAKIVLDVPVVYDFVCSLLQTYPAKKTHFLPFLKPYLMTSKAQSKLLKAMSLIVKIIEFQNPVEVLTFAVSHCPSQLVAVALSITTAEVLTAKFLDKLICNDSFDIRHEGILYCNTIVQKMISIVDNQQVIALFPNNDSFARFKSKYVKRFSYHLPSRESLVKFGHLTVKALTLKTETVPFVSTSWENKRDCFSHLQQLLPVLVVVSRSNVKHQDISNFFCELISVLDSQEAQTKDSLAIHRCYLSILECFLNLNYSPRQIFNTIGERFFKIVVHDAIGLIGVEDATVQKLALEFQSKFLLKSGLFNGVEKEVTIWLDVLQRYLHMSNTKAVPKFLADIICFQLISGDQINKDFVKNIYEDPNLVEKLKGSFRNILDELLSSEEDDATTHKLFASSQGLFSTLVITALIFIEKTDFVKSVCKRFLANVLTDIINNQKQPMDLILLLRHYQKILPDWFVKNLKDMSSLSSSRVENPDDKLQKLSLILAEKNLEGLMKYVFQRRSHSDLNDECVSECVANASGDQLLLVCIQIIKYVNNIDRESDVDQNLIVFYCGVLRSIIAANKSSNTNLNHCARVVLINRFVVSCVFEHAVSSDAKVYCAPVTKLVIEAIGHFTDLKPFSLLTARFNDVVAEWLGLKSDGSKVKKLKLTQEVIERLAGTWSLPNLQRLLNAVLQFSADKMISNKSQSFTDVGKLLFALVNSISTQPDLKNSLNGEELSTIAGLYKDIYVSMQYCHYDEEWKQRMSRFGQSLLRLLEAVPFSSFSIQNDFLEFCLKVHWPQHLSIANLLLDCNVTNFYWLQQWLLNSSEWCQHLPAFATVVLKFIKYTNSAVFLERFQIPETDDLVSRLSKAYWSKLSKVKNEDIYLELASVLLNHISVNKKKKYLDSVCFKSSEYLKLLSLQVCHRIIRDVLSSCEQEDDVDWISNYLSQFVQVCYLKLLSISNSSKNTDSSNLLSTVKKVVDMTSTVFEHKDGLSALVTLIDVENVSLQLKNLLSTKSLNVDVKLEFLNLYCMLLDCFHHHGQLSDTSSFVDIILKQFEPVKDNKSVSEELNSHLLNFLLFIVKATPNVCHESHVLQFLDMYSPDFTSANRTILALIFQYEKNGLPLKKLEPFIWSAKSKKFYFHILNDKSLKPSERRNAFTMKIVKLLDADQVLRTALTFPQELNLDVMDLDVEAVPKFLVCSEFYDPRFLLPLFSSAINNNRNLSVILRLFKTNLLALTLAALGSAVVEMRGIGYYILSVLHETLGKRAFKSCFLWFNFLDIIRRSVKKPGARLSRPVITFLIMSCVVLTKPATFYLSLEKPILSYLCQKSSVKFDIESVFAHLVKINIAHPRRLRFTKWILNALAHSLKDYEDYVFLEKYGVFKTLLCFCYFKRAVTETKMKILEVIKSVVSIPKACCAALATHDLLAFLRNVLKDCTNETLSKLVLTVVRDAWKSLVALRNLEEEDSASTSKTDGQLPTSVLSEFYFCILDLTISFDKISVEMSSVFEELVETLSSVYLRLCQTLHDAGEYYGFLFTPASVQKLVQLISKMQTKTSKTMTSAVMSNAVFDIIITFCNSNLNSSYLLTKSGTGATEYVDALVTALSLLLNTLPFQESNYGKLEKIYDCLTTHLENDNDGLSVLLVEHMFRFQYDISLFVFQCYQHLLSSTVIGVHNSITEQCSEDNLDHPGSLLASINCFITTLMRNNYIKENSVTDFPVQHQRFLKFLTSAELEEDLRNPLCQQDTSGSSLSLEVAVAMDICTRWSHNPETSCVALWKSVELIGNCVNSDVDNDQRPSSRHDKPVKRKKSFSDSENVKKQRLIDIK